jgi:phosphoesterase RecJ-like protein
MENSVPGMPSPSPGNAAKDPMAAILEVLRHAERFLISSHSRPDGDAVGSMLAMGMLLRQMGKYVDLMTADRIPAIYRGLPGAESIQTALRVHGSYDAAILLECDSLARTRLQGLEQFFLINIDHHATGRHWSWPTAFMPPCSPIPAAFATVLSSPTLLPLRTNW